jgi:hypothetical protein
VEKYSTTCHGWIIFLDEKRDDKSNELTFIKDGCQTHENSWMTHYFTHKIWNNFMLVSSWKVQHMKCWCYISRLYFIFF